MSEYYRGSSSYELAVKDRLRSLEASGAATTSAIRSMESSISSDIRQSTYAIVASQQALAATFQHGFNALNNTISFGFEMMNSKFAMMGKKLDEICSKLDAIHDIVNNPLLTASRELYRRALTNYEKGYFEEALEDCKAAVEKNKTDFISWNLLGQIYLFGAGKFSNVINLDEAENAFFTAAKYIDADIGKSSEANHLASEIYYYLGYTKLVKSNDYLVESKIDDSTKKLIEAESSSGRSYKISKDNLLAGYEQAKELHFLERDDEALQILEEVIRAEKNYALKASCDKNFESLWDRIDELITRLRDELAGKINDACEKILAEGKKRVEEMKNELASMQIPSEGEIAKIPSGWEPFWNTVHVTGHYDGKFKDGEEVKSAFRNIVEEKNELPNEIDNILSLLNKRVSVWNAEGKNYFSLLDLWNEVSSKTVAGWVESFTSSTSSSLEKMEESLEEIKHVLSALKIGSERDSRDAKIFTLIFFACLFVSCLFAMRAHGHSFDDYPFSKLFSGLFALGGGLAGVLCAETAYLNLNPSILCGISLAIVSFVMFFAGHPVLGVIDLLASLVSIVYAITWKSKPVSHFSGDVLDNKKDDYFVSSTESGSNPCILKAPVSGTLIKYIVPEGSLVSGKHTVAIIESMKMELEIKAGANGNIHFLVPVDAQVTAGQDIAEIK